MKRIQVGATERVRNLQFVDAAGAGVTGLSPTVRIWREDGQFWNGSGYQAGVVNLAMTAVDATNMPGVYQYAFVATGGQVSEDQHGVLVAANSASVRNASQGGEFTVGQWVDNIDAAISSRATQADILSDATPFAGANIDAAISSRAAPGAAMDLVVDAVDAAALATDAVAEIIAALLAAATGGGDTVDVALSRLTVLDDDSDSLRDHIEGRRLINQTDSAQHREEVYRRTGSRSGAGGSLLEQWDLADQAGAAVNDANPLPQAPVSAFDRDPT